MQESSVSFLKRAVLIRAKIKKKERMIRVKWTMVAKVLKLVATIITTIVGTLAVQSCGVLH